MNSTKYYVNPIIASFIILPSVVVITFGVGIGAAILGSEYESSCVVNEEKEPVCTTRYAFKGAGNLDISMPQLQAVAGVIATSVGIFSGVKSGNIQKALKLWLKDSSSNESETEEPLS